MTDSNLPCEFTPARPPVIGIVSDHNAAASEVYSQLFFRELRRRPSEQLRPLILAHYFFPSGAGAKGQATVSGVQHAAATLADQGASQVLIGASSLSIFAAELERRPWVRVCDLCGVTASAVHRLRLSPAGLLGASSEDERALWRKRLREHGVEVLVPTESECEMIRSRMDCGTVTSEARASVVGVMSSLRQNGARSVILCSPELGQIFREEDSLLPLVCAAEQQIKAAIGAVYGGPQKVG